MTARDELQSALLAARATAKAERDHDRGLFLDGVVEGLERAVRMLGRDAK